ncbi:MAG: hypothetical protein JXB85_09760 [Anaerolineales bacterium]|nr:hypothetical protein [Anaerolineales bacterium]
MKRFDYRILLGSLLVLGGVLLLLDRTGILEGATRFFWAGLFGLGAGIFLYMFFTNLRSKWWAAIPGFALAGIAASSLLLDQLGLGGLAFLGGLGLGFYAVYFSGRDRWWALIPGGVLVTLGAVSAISDTYHVLDSGGVFFLGLGLTFLLVGLLAGMRWAYIPAGVLLVLGLLAGVPFEGIGEYVWIGALLLGGLAMIAAALWKK